MAAGHAGLPLHLRRAAPGSAIFGGGDGNREGGAIIHGGGGGGGGGGGWFGGVTPTPTPAPLHQRESSEVSTRVKYGIAAVLFCFVVVLVAHVADVAEVRCVGHGSPVVALVRFMGMCDVDGDSDTRGGGASLSQAMHAAGLDAFGIFFFFFFFWGFGP